MSEQISVGDLAVVVHWPCCKGDIGYTDVVQSIEQGAPRGGYCSYCGEKHFYSPQLKALMQGAIFPIAWLKRIPPLGELEGAKDAADKPITLDDQIERLRKMVQA